MGGWKKAVDGGPWMFDTDLLAMEEFDPNKALDDYLFTHVPVWVRVYKLPLGKMKRDMAVLICDRVGEFMEVDGMEDNLEIGRCLRIKVRKCLAEPLMHGMMVEIDEKGKTIWCPMEYEHLPDFCYICGLIGHVEKSCSQKLKRVEELQFGKWLRWVPPKRRVISPIKEVGQIAEEGGVSGWEAMMEEAGVEEKGSLGGKIPHVARIVARVGRRGERR
jgi:hypothetical protein